MSAERLERLTDRIYDAVAEPAAWREVLAELADLAGAGQAMLLTASVVTGASDAVFYGNVDRSAPAEFHTYYSAINPLTRMGDPSRYLAVWQPTIIRDEDILPREALQRTEYYNDFLRPLGAEHGIYLRLERRGEIVTNISLGRSSARGRFGQDTDKALSPVYSHLKRAAALRWRFRELSQFTAATTLALDAAPEAALLLDAVGCVVYANDAAERLLADGTLLRRSGRCLIAFAPRVAAALASAIAAATKPGERRGGVVALVGTDGHRAGEASVLPLSLDAALAANGPAVLVRISPLADVGRTNEAMDGFGLTRAERALALALIDGQSLRHAAAARGVSINTVRCQLAGLFNKTGARRQTELVALLTRENKALRTCDAGCV
ncbi:helix-turn-helix transcriptional regulator [Sphingomonas bacterium]|uniref:helix-turn-helix transcriptional regulator n=1 Tax=Sphingomonas bacterium TaxID=1895847 RepID=UPI001576CDF7|nr:hypothetical protein [Sphingomonas bacterium]